MWLEQIIREQTGCATYLIGSDDVKECLVLDPLWDIRPYLRLARRKGSRIRFVIDSHTHADHVSGARRLAAAAGAELLLPAGAEAEYEARRVMDGERIRMGEVVLEIVHVPGHRPEQINLLVTDESRGDLPWSLLTADFILVGDIARPDLAMGGEEGAGMIFDQALPRIAGLPDFVEVYPGHVAGSTCGRVTSGKHATTLGYERRFNTAMTLADRSDFIRFLNHGQPSRPANVENIVLINQGRRPYAAELPALQPIPAAEVARMLEAGSIFLIDTRYSGPFGEAHIPGSVNIQVSQNAFEQRVGWLLPGDQRIVLVAATESDAAAALEKLAFVGLESRVAGYLEGGMEAWTAAGGATSCMKQVTAAQLNEMMADGAAAPQVLDVREQDEWDAGHIDGAVRMNFKHLSDGYRSLGLDPEQPVVVYCASGNRSSTAGSLLEARGFKRVHNLVGGIDAWREAGYPVE
jgi:rhodanese-related sulfurtransferase/glyoxylase-like metal-dependent hydrolase (beta-lactamase superfamily II)